MATTLTTEECNALLDELQKTIDRASERNPRFYTEAEEKRIIEIAEILKNCDITPKSK